MKYYVYVSDSKVDMLIPQMADDRKKKIAIDFKIDLKLLSASWKSEKEAVNERIQRLEAVSSFIRNWGNIGTTDNPDEWVEGTLLMSWLVVPESNLVYLTTTKSSRSKTIVGLGGSAKHIVGNSAPPLSPASRSMLWEIMRELNRHFGNISEGKSEDFRNPDSQTLQLVRDVSEEVESLGSLFARFGHDDSQTNMQTYPPVQQKVEFLAKRLFYDKVNPSRRSGKKIKQPVLIATPIYIALAE